MAGRVAIVSDRRAAISIRLWLLAEVILIINYASIEPILPFLQATAIPLVVWGVSRAIKAEELSLPGRVSTLLASPVCDSVTLLAMAGAQLLIFFLQLPGALVVRVALLCGATVLAAAAILGLAHSTRMQQGNDVNVVALFTLLSLRWFFQ